MLYLSFISSPGLFLHQNLLVWSLDPEHNTWPSGCQERLQMKDSCADSMPPTSRLCPTIQNRIAPSDPPLAKRDSWTGCQATVFTSFLCPLRTYISFIILMSKILIR